MPRWSNARLVDTLATCARQASLFRSFQLHRFGFRLRLLGGWQSGLVPHGGESHACQIISPINNVGAPDVAAERQYLLAQITEHMIPGLEFFSRRARSEPRHNWLAWL